MKFHVFKILDNFLSGGQNIKYWSKKRKCENSFKSFQYFDFIFGKVLTF